MNNSPRRKVSDQYHSLLNSQSQTSNVDQNSIESQNISANSNSTKTDYPSYATLTRSSKEHSRPHSLQSYSNQENPYQSQLQDNPHSQNDFSGENRVDLNENENKSSIKSDLVSKLSEFEENSENWSKLFPPSKEQISDPDRVENSAPFLSEEFSRNDEGNKMLPEKHIF